MDDRQLLQHYLDRHAPEAQVWNLSPDGLFLEYAMREQLSRCVEPRGEFCNVGIGTGDWDDWLGYWLGANGRVTSIDSDASICECFAYRQKREGHPNPATV